MRRQTHPALGEKAVKIKRIGGTQIAQAGAEKRRGRDLQRDVLKASRPTRKRG